MTDASDPYGWDSITKELFRTLDHKAVEQWWLIRVPALGTSPSKALAEGRGREVMRVVRSYSDPSFD